MGKKVMLVDDATFMRLKLKAILTEFGHEVVGEASTGRIAIDQYQSLKPEVVLMDITMPDMNGLDALREIKKLDPQATVVMVSAMGSQEFVLDAVRSGARDFIVKPFDNERIRKVLDSL
jgi:two-component system chemotaxis response regulator CheY